MKKKKQVEMWPQLMTLKGMKLKGGILYTHHVYNLEYSQRKLYHQTEDPYIFTVENLVL